MKIHCENLYGNHSNSGEVVYGGEAESQAACWVRHCRVIFGCIWCECGAFCIGGHFVPGAFVLGGFLTGG